MSHVTLSQIRFLLDSIHGILDVNYKKTTDEDMIIALTEMGIINPIVDEDEALYINKNGKEVE